MTQRPLSDNTQIDPIPLIFQQIVLVTDAIHGFFQPFKFGSHFPPFRFDRLCSFSDSTSTVLVAATTSTDVLTSMLAAFSAVFFCTEFVRVGTCTCSRCRIVVS